MTGLNLVSAQVLALIVLAAVQDGRSILLDVALVYDIFGFIGILALARYFRDREEKL
jgi:multicomponent Na+:H+ antiporter subunit F